MQHAHLTSINIIALHEPVSTSHVTHITNLNVCDVSEWVTMISGNGELLKQAWKELRKTVFYNWTILVIFILHLIL